MFFHGSLQEGIATALSQAKLVLCFVTDDEGESRLWETVYLRDATLAPLIESKTIALRLEAQSEEAGYLAAIFPLPKTPTIVIIKNGELKEYISAGVSVDEFTRRIAAALSEVQDSANAASAAPAPLASTASAIGSTADQGSDRATPSSREEQSATSSQSSANSRVAGVLAERAARLTAQREAAAAEERRKREIAKGKKKAEREDEAQREGAGLPPSDTKKHAETLRRKKQEDGEARKRIQKRIEDDKAARRAEKAQRAAEREMERKAALGIADEEDSVVVEKASSMPTSSSSASKPTRTETCALQVRLLDGTSLKRRFPSSNSLKEVRSWIDESREDGTHPYTFKLVLTPLANRILDVTEESESLASLGLCPSATLLLLPVDKYSAAYAEATGATMLSTVMSPVLPRSRQSDSSAPQRSGISRDQETRRGTSREQDARQKDYQLYNGNSLNFEPRKDEEDEGA